jgi:hypothetical protein
MSLEQYALHLPAQEVAAHEQASIQRQHHPSVFFVVRGHRMNQERREKNRKERREGRKIAERGQ